MNKRSSHSKILFRLFVILSCLLSFFLAQSYNNMQSHIIIITWMSALVVFLTKLNFSHPYFWFTIFFYLYNCAYTIILLIAPDDKLAIGYNTQATLLILAALLAFLIPINPQLKIYNTKSFSSLKVNLYDKYAISAIMRITLIVLVVSLIILAAQGVTSKQAQWESHNMSWAIAAYCIRIIPYCGALLFFIDGNIKKNRGLIVSCCVGVALFTLLTGERDGVLRLIVVAFFVYAVSGRIKPKTLFVMAPIGVAVMLVSNYFKYFFSTGSLNRDPLALENIVYEFLYSDFVECGANLQTLLGESSLVGIKGYSTLISDFLAAFLPGSLMNALFGDINNWNISEWYNNYFFPGATYSRAFTLVGEGYVIGGLVGTFIMFFIIGNLVNYLYRKSDENPYLAALYVYCATSIISSFRGDLASMFIASIRIPLLVYIFILFMRRHYKKTLRDAK